LNKDTAGAEIHITRNEAFIFVGKSDRAVRLKIGFAFKVQIKVNFIEFVGFEVFVAVVMKSIIFWDMTRTTRHHIPEDNTLY
jgi:hypothetical protein